MGTVVLREVGKDFWVREKKGEALGMHAWRGDAWALPEGAEGLGKHCGFFLTQKSFPTFSMPLGTTSATARTQAEELPSSRSP